MTTHQIWYFLSDKQKILYKHKISTNFMKIILVWTKKGVKLCYLQNFKD